MFYKRAFVSLKKGEKMTEQEQYERLAAGFAKLDNDKRAFLDDYTWQLVKTCCPGEEAALARIPAAGNTSPKGAT